MKTKTPEQVAAQTRRILEYFGLKHWNGKEYADKDRLMLICDRVININRSYIDAIYSANGVCNRRQEWDTEMCNRIWRDAATERIVYAGY